MDFALNSTFTNERKKIEYRHLYLRAPNIDQQPKIEITLFCKNEIDNIYNR